MNNFELIPVPLPPMLAEDVGVTSACNYFSLYYMSSKATWSNGRSTGNFSFYGVYQPLIDHIAINIYLWNCNLGSDDSFPAHAILCDRSNQKMYTGKYEEVEKFLDSQHPQRQKQKPTLQEWLEIKQYLESKTIQQQTHDWQQQGMFEFFGNISPQLQHMRKLLVQWLDRQITQDLLERYLEQASSGNFKAIHALKSLQARMGMHGRFDS